MTETTPLTPFLKTVFPEASAGLLTLLEAAAEQAGVLRSDFFTIRDWLEVAESPGHETAVVMLLVLMLALDEGSLCAAATEDSVGRRLADLVGPDAATLWARRVLEDLGRVRFPRLIGTSPSADRPVILHTIGEDRYLYFQKYLKAEIDFHQHFTALLHAPGPAPPPPNLAAALREVLTEQPLRLGTNPLTLDRDQQLAVGTALLRPLTIISGGPGTGKTSIVLTLLRCLVRCGYQPERIALAAPTGRAAQRLSDALRAGLDSLPPQREDSPDHALRDLTSSTLHQLLAYRPNRNVFGRHAENPIPADVVIVDEASMVGLVLMAQLVQALEPGCKLILLGDKDQLPSVDAGAVLAALVPDDAATGFSAAVAKQLAEYLPGIEAPVSGAARPLQDTTVLLRTNHRSQPQIRDAAAAINRRDTELVDRLPPVSFPSDLPRTAVWQQLEAEGGCRLLEQVHGTPAEIRAFLRPWAEHAYLGSQLKGDCLADLVMRAQDMEAPENDAAPDALSRMFTLLDRFRLLTLLREGPWGAVDINRFLDQTLRPRLDPGARGNLFAGAPVLITRNDPLHQLNNGDVGLALRFRDGRLRVVFSRGGAVLALPEESLPAHELGFALTIHKSQGSEYGQVLVVLPPEGGRRLLTKELLYTAITRAKSLAVLCGTREVVRLAISRQVFREAGLLQTLGRDRKATVEA
jgi:exodeoxyribonuclease V alpha subunit